MITLGRAGMIALAAAIGALPARAQRPEPARTVAPVLEFPVAGLDDTAAYRGYRTRFYRDAADNTVQVYLDARAGRVVTVLADADNESVGFTVLGDAARPARLRWGSEGARVWRAGRSRVVEYDLIADDASVDIGHVLLGSMRVERDFQASGGDRVPLDHGLAYVPPDLTRLVSTIEHLPAAEQRQHLDAVHAADVEALRARTAPELSVHIEGPIPRQLFTQESIDGLDTLSVEFEIEAVHVALDEGWVFGLSPRDRTPLRFRVRIRTTAGALTPLSRSEIFTPEFLAWLASASAAPGEAAQTRARWLEREVRGVELLASREKLMAGLPTYGTYFGRDMLMTALMMRPIWRDQMSGFAIAAALRKLSPTGQVSHEEALGGQAVREAAAEYVALIDSSLVGEARGDSTGAQTLRARALDVLAHARRTRENYHMIDDELQLAVLAGRWLADTSVPAATRRSFLLGEDAGEQRVVRLWRELALVARMTDAYARDPVATNLIAFVPRDSTHWESASWRDSNAGYANGRFAFDVNAIWAPHALESMARILDAVDSLALPRATLFALSREAPADTPLGRYVRWRATLDSAVATWNGAWDHFVVRLAPAAVDSAVTGWLAAMPDDERGWWTSVAGSGRVTDTLVFAALSLDRDGRPIRVMNTDPATWLFLGPHETGSPVGDRASVARGARIAAMFARPFPLGMLVDRVGPVVTNDAFAAPEVRALFARDAYHGPRVVWGRDVNLFLLGVARELGTDRARRDATYASALRAAADRVQRAVETSGFRAELWSYAFRNGRPAAVRYGSGGDVQLWSTTDLAVQFELSARR